LLSKSDLEPARARFVEIAVRTEREESANDVAVLRRADKGRRMRERISVRCGIAGALLASAVACSPSASMDAGRDAGAALVSDSASDAASPQGADAGPSADAWTVADAQDSGGEASAPAIAPDFSLPDLNPNSASFRRDVSPRARRGQITAWYFATAT
jgi:hypothetical protein